MKNFILLIVMGFTFSSCEKVVNIDLNNAVPALVIEGNITNASNVQVVSVSRTINFSEPNTFQAVSNAVITISSRNRNYNLMEKSPGVYVADRLTGRPGEKYDLKVIVGGKEYTASSTMPTAVNLDSLAIGETSFGREKNKFVQAAFFDPVETENNYRFKLYVNEKPSKNIFVFSDYLTNGRNVFHDLNDFDTEINSGDEITVEMQCIDKNNYRYWSGLSQNENRGGASTTPANPVSNINNGALGYFSAHTVERKAIKAE